MKNRNGQQRGSRPGKNGQASSARKVYTFTNLFCGVGGMRLAFEHCGAMCLWASEQDNAARQTYWENFGDSPVGDLSTVDSPSLPDADILCATLRVERGVRAGNRSALGDVVRLARKHDSRDARHGAILPDSDASVKN